MVFRAEKKTSLKRQDTDSLNFRISTQNTSKRKIEDEEKREISYEEKEEEEEEESVTVPDSVRRGLEIESFCQVTQQRLTE